MEKRLLLFLLLTFALIIVWSRLFSPPPKRPAEPDTAQGTSEPPGGKPPVPPEDGPRVEPEPEPKAPPPSDEPSLPAPVGEDEVAVGATEPLDTLTSRWVFDSWGGSVREVRLKGFSRSADEKADRDLNNPENWYRALSPWKSDWFPKKDPGDWTAREHRAVTMDLLDGAGGVALRLSQVDWGAPEITGSRIVFRLPIPAAGVVIEKEFVLPDAVEGLEVGPYHADVKLTLSVTDRELAARYGGEEWRFRLRSAGGVPLDQFGSGMTVVGAALMANDVSAEEFSPPGRFDKDTEPEVYPDPEDQGGDRILRWVGVHGRFFGAILMAKDPKEVGATQAVFQPANDKAFNGDEAVNLAPALDFPVSLPAAGEKVERSFLFYVGPMDPDVLAQGPYAPLEPVIDYGMFGVIAKALLALLGVIRAVVVNWGIAIIVLTLIVRLAMFPISRRSQLSMQKYQRQMGRLKPKMDAIRQKHGKNKKKMNEEMMKMYREEGVSMVPKGCLVMFLQLPIFIGLFQALRYAIDLRHSAFLWATDLTAPDRLFLIAKKPGLFFLPEPFYLNIFPILMGFTWYLSSAMAPKPADPQQAQQMKMMKWFPIIFSLLLYNYPAGLALYMVTSSCWSIFEMKVVRKLLAKGEPEVADGVAGFRRGK
jgi:YidC/Oxa1 family membrane protein insertase